MTMINIDQLEIGMVTASPVHCQGRVILAGNTVITEKMITKCQAWGVIEIDIVGEAHQREDPFEELAENEKNKIREQIDFRFGEFSDDNEFMRGLYAYALNYKLHQAVEQKKGRV